VTQGHQERGPPRWGEQLTDALDDVSERLTTADLAELNRSVELEGLTAEDAADRWWDGG
jgi:glycine betaine/choline ABC-type transport system substrate-binding protein